MRLRMMTQTVIIMIYMIELAGLIFVTQPQYKKKHYVPVKMLCSLSFVGAAIVFGIVSGHVNYMAYLMGPLVMCALGDLFMGLYQVGSHKRQLVLGIIFFLMAHVGLIYTMFRLDGRVDVINFLLPVMMVIIFLIVKKKCHIHMGRVTYLACVYCGFLSFMLAKAISYMVFNFSLAGAWIGIAGILFFASDFSIIFLYFYKFKNKTNRQKVHIFNLLTYFMAVMAFDISILYMVMI